MRSTVDDFIVVMTDNINYPIIVFRQGKGAWVPPVDTAPYIYIIDVAFLGDTLYAITNAEDLIPLNLLLDCDGTPVVIIGKRVIRQPPGYDDYDAWSASDDDEGHDVAYDDDDDSEEVENEEVADDDDDDVEKEENNEVVDDDDDDVEEDENEKVADDDTSNIEEEKEVALDQALQEEDDGSHPFSFSGEETDAAIIISRHLIVSRGELLLVRRHVKPTYDYLTFTRRVDILEADANTGAWVPPVGTGLGGGRALFISMNFSKFVFAPCGEVEEDVVYDIHTGEVFDMKSQTSRQGHFCICFQAITWLFPPELVL
ncbi:hypothetical protein VPH35_080456 [Triticum aestivum]|uniref:pheromone-processing carboxypeptidase KEX1-like n=1 Tax=Triticum aestivum TaxID=4565 RepID=UPI000843B924|nr:pheromone-processing carboxypeptidase KEX1-like [Triticum aestivum]